MIFMTVITLESITLEIVVDAVAGGTGGADVRDVAPKFPPVAAVVPYLSNSEIVRFLVDELPVLPSLKNAMELASFSLKASWLADTPDIENQM